MMTELADFINVNTKISQMKHCPCLRYAIIYRHNLYKIYIPEKIAEKNLIKN